MQNKRKCFRSRKILAPIKIKSALPPPQKKKQKKYPPPKTRNSMGIGFSCRKNACFQAPIKLAQPFPAPELRAKHFTDTRIFLIVAFERILNDICFSISDFLETCQFGQVISQHLPWNVKLFRLLEVWVVQWAGLRTLLEQL